MNRKQKKMLFRIIVSSIIFIVALIFPKSIVKQLLFFISYIIAGYDIIFKAIKNIFNLRILDENFLMFIASVGAFLIGEYPEACAVSLFYQVGELFQSYAVGKSRKHIKELMNINPEYANIEIDGKVEKVDPKDVKIGDIILVYSGEKIPLDGIVDFGEASVDTSLVTGESVPQYVEKGSKITSGCILLEGVVKIKVTREFENSTVAKILNLLTESTEKKSKSENFITKFSKIYTPFVVICAFILGVVIPLFFPVDTALWVRKALVFLVVSCPCALIISVPLSFFGGIGSASKNGILIKGSQYIESLSKASTIIFDKTGTITTGKPVLKEIVCENMEESEFLKTVAMAEYYSNHPVSYAIKNAYTDTILTDEIKDFKSHTGLGVSATINGNSVVAGNEKLLTDLNLDFVKSDRTGTVIYVAVNGKYCGYLLISDEIKEDTKTAISNLKKCGIKKTVLLTGDKKEIGEKTGKEAGIHIIYSELLPQDKVQYAKNIKKEMNKSDTLVFVGDGINDAPVLAFCDVGISMGAMGSDVAIEASDFVIMDDNPLKIANAIKISKFTMKIAKQNIAISLFIKFLFLILGAIGLSGLWGAVFADVGVTVIAILNAFRTLKYKV